ncbi:MAG: putative ABC transporter permease [Hominilimicola sp.]
MAESFASGMNFYKLFWVFFIGCFLGVVIETIWCLLRLGHIESRAGLIYGPFNLVYGLGALLMTITLVRFTGYRDLWIFLVGSLIGGIFEYVCSFVQEKLFGTVSWNYKNFPLNLNGRVNMLYCFFWGLLALVWVKDLYPKMSWMIEKIPNAYGKPLTWLCLIFMGFNTIMSSCVVYRMSKRQKGIHSSNIFWKYIDTHYDDERVKRIYPNMKLVGIMNKVNEKADGEHTVFYKHQVQTKID